MQVSTHNALFDGPSRMPHRLALLLVLLTMFLPRPANAAARKPHVISFGGWQKVKMSVDAVVDSEEPKLIDIRVRPLLVDGKVREYSTGEAHDVTDRLFVLRRAYRVNDALPEDGKSGPRWKWQLGGWLSVDRLTAHISVLSLPDFDPYYSTASWYRAYVAYCGLSGDGVQSIAVVAQIGRKKPALKKPLGARSGKDSECAAPKWQRQPIRVSFQSASGAKAVFDVRGHNAEPAPAADADDEE